MKTLTYTFPRVGSPSPQSATIQTTLYDLIDAIAAEVRPDEEALVTAAAVHLLRSCQAKLTRFIDGQVRDQVCYERADYLSAANAS